MTIDSVRAFLAAHAPDIHILETDDSTATVEMAAAGHGVAPAQIAKTLSLRIKDRTILVVTSGTARLNNRKIKDLLGGKPRMLAADEVVALTGHPVGGLCPSIATSRSRHSTRWCRPQARRTPRCASRHSAWQIS